MRRGLVHVDPVVCPGCSGTSMEEGLNEDGSAVVYSCSACGYRYDYGSHVEAPIPKRRYEPVQAPQSKPAIEPSQLPGYQEAQDFARQYYGSFPFMVSMREAVQAGRVLTPSMIRGILNCKRFEERARRLLDR